MKEFLFIGLSNEKRQAVEDIFNRFLNIRNLEAKAVFFDKMAAVLTYCKSGHFPIFFICCEIDIVNKNALVALFHEKSLKIDHVVTLKKNIIALAGSMPNSQIYPADEDFSPQYIFDCLNSLMYSQGIELDIRIAQNILVSVVDVIRSNTKIAIRALKIIKSQPKGTSKWDFISCVTVFGDGINGAIVIKANKKFIETALKNIIGNEPANPSEPSLYTDFMDETTNQIIGVFRNNLAEHSYQLETSWRLVIDGESQKILNRSVGKYYVFPFDVDGNAMEIEFCYQSYLRSIKEDYRGFRSTFGRKCLDVRIVNAVVESVLDLIKIVPDLSAKWSNIEKYNSNDTTMHKTLHFLSCVGSQGEIIFYLSLPENTQDIILSKYKMDRSFWEDIENEMYNQLRGNIKNRLRPFHYFIENQFEAKFIGTDQLRSYYRSNGRSVKLEFIIIKEGVSEQIEMQNADPLSFNLIMEVNSSFAHSWFDLSDYFDK
ncbi:MAG: chemotaxis protein CheX [Oligoflexales bacterium]|nr:chemotaxis protein CheX [Oligoflexales bacterium]